jgi:cell division protein FtsQ
MSGTARGGDRSRGRSGGRAGSAAEGARESWSRGRKPTERADADTTESAPRPSGTRTARTRAGAAAARRAERDRARVRADTTRDSSRTLKRRPRPAAPRSADGPTRGRYLARRWVAVLAVLAVVAVAYLVMFTSLLGVRSVEVIGTKEVSKADVVKAAAIEHGTPMVRLDAAEAAARVATLPRVFEVVVQRSWPSTVEIIVTERNPVAVRKAGAELHLIDATGLDYAVTKTAPPGLPTLAMDDIRPDNPATEAAVTVLGALPAQLKPHVVTVSAATPGDVRLTLADGRVVKWGNARDNARKAAVLAPLLTRPGKTYDVATPDFPTVAG